MSKVFLHFEGEPAFTLKLILGQIELPTIADVVEVRCCFSAGFNRLLSISNPTDDILFLDHSIS